MAFGAQEYREFLLDIISWMTSGGLDRFTVEQLHLNRVVRFRNEYPSRQTISSVLEWLNNRFYIYRVREPNSSLGFYWYVTSAGQAFANDATTPISPRIKGVC